MPRAVERREELQIRRGQGARAGPPLISPAPSRRGRRRSPGAVHRAEPPRGGGRSSGLELRMSFRAHRSRRRSPAGPAAGGLEPSTSPPGQGTPFPATQIGHLRSDGHHRGPRRRLASHDLGRGQELDGLTRQRLGRRLPDGDDRGDDDPQHQHRHGRLRRHRTEGAPDPPGDLEDGERREPAVADEDEEEIAPLPVRQRHDEEKRQRGQEDEEHGPPAVAREAQPHAYRRERAHRQKRQPCAERLEERVAEMDTYLRANRAGSWSRTSANDVNGVDRVMANARATSS